MFLNRGVFSLTVLAQYHSITNLVYSGALDDFSGGTYVEMN